MARPRGLAALLGAQLATQTSANSMYLAKLCRGQTCTDPKHPILDFSEAEDRCICRAHPCWDDDGVSHACDSEAYPFLAFTYNEERKLSCGCSETPSYASSHITQDLCPGNYCENPEHPVLDWDEERGECICRAHPCWDVDGVRHACSDPKFPLLRYREDEADSRSGKAKPVCECVAKLDPPARTEL